MEFILIVSLLAVISAYIAQKKGRSFGLWYVYGWLLFIVALIHSLLLKDLDNIECPKCKEAIKKDALVCKHCQADLITFL